MTTTAISRPKRLVASALLLVTLMPLGAARQASAACDPAVPPDVCNLIPTGADTMPIDQVAVVGRTYITDTPAVKLGSYLYMHNLDTVDHYIVFTTPPVFKKLDPREAGPVGEKLQVSIANGFAKNITYPFFCSAFPEMTGTLTVT